MCVQEDVDITLHAILANNQTPNRRHFQVWQSLVLDQQKDIHHLGMGSASSVLQSEAGRPLDGSDIQTADEALEEVRRIRNILASASALPEPWVIYEDENGYVYYHNTSTNEVQWNHPLSTQPVESNQEAVAAAPNNSCNGRKSLLLYHSKLRTAAEHVVQRLLKEEVEYEHKINLEMLEYIASCGKS